MGRRKKKNNNLRNIGLGVIVASVGLFGYLSYVNGDFQLPVLDKFYQFRTNTRVQEPLVDGMVQKVEETTQTNSKIKIFFIGNKDGKDIYRTVYRTNNTDKSDIEFAVVSLLSGPTKYEREKGIYSEIPSARLISVTETANRVTINLSESFGTGGGTDSIYKRMYQLIKTVNYNTDKPVYLNLNGRQIETIGGEGLMLKQPLNGSSLDD